MDAWVVRLLWLAFAFFCGSLPISVWIGQWGLNKDITQVGDHNPGATNVYRSGGVAWYLLALCLDISKAAVPVGIATQFLGWAGWWLLPLAFAPILGHAFSPFLKFQGGKALAATYGSWVGLTLWWYAVPLFFLFLLSYALVKGDGWVIMATMSSFLLCLLLTGAGGILATICALNLAFFVYKHWAELHETPSLRFGRNPT